MSDTHAVAAPSQGVVDESAAHVQRLRGQAQTCWANAIALTQVLGDADKHQVVDVEVDGPNGLQKLGDLLSDRIAELNQTTKNGQERGAA